VRTGINEIDAWGSRLGLGEYTGIDLPGESKGYRASRETKKLLRSDPSDQIWFPADTCQSAIGQFDNSFTILQLAVYTAALATGNRVTPLRDRHRYPWRRRRDPRQPSRTGAIGLKESTLAAVRAGMIAVVASDEGTAYAPSAISRSRLPPRPVQLKPGSRTARPPTGCLSATPPPMTRRWQSPRLSRREPGAPTRSGSPATC
jgi:cell division protein FtsI/penicillin-binding protein 2